jgi:hypothetical protein
MGEINVGMTASERIQELAKESHKHCIDPCFNGNVPDISDYLNAIIQFLDEQESRDNHWRHIYTPPPKP